MSFWKPATPRRKTLADTGHLPRIKRQSLSDHGLMLATSPSPLQAPSCQIVSPTELEVRPGSTTERDDVCEDDSAMQATNGVETACRTSTPVMLDSYVFGQVVTPTSAHRKARAERKARIEARNLSLGSTRNPSQRDLPGPALMEDRRYGTAPEASSSFITSKLLSHVDSLHATPRSYQSQRYNASISTASVTGRLSMESLRPLLGEPLGGGANPRAWTYDDRHAHSSVVERVRRSTMTTTIAAKIRVFEHDSLLSTDAVLSKVRSRANSMRRSLSTRASKAIHLPIGASPGSRLDVDAGLDDNTRGSVSMGAPVYKLYATHVLGPSQKIGRRGNIVGTWNFDIVRPPTMTAPPTGTRGEVPMVVKGVQCAVQQPRPVRMGDMRRMTALCKDRVGSLVGSVKRKKRSSVWEGRL